jgi:hypothetical protein
MSDEKTPDKHKDEPLSLLESRERLADPLRDNVAFVLYSVGDHGIVMADMMFVLQQLVNDRLGTEPLDKERLKISWERALRHWRAHAAAVAKEGQEDQAKNG